MNGEGPLFSYGGLFPKTEEAAFIAASSVLVGDVRVGKDASVWFASVLRGDINFIEVGDYSNVQDGCLLHVTRELPVLVGKRVTLGHGVILHGCRIKDDCLIGMGATVLDGAVIGEGSIIAARALVPEGRVVPPGSLVMGIPGKTMRSLVPEEILHIREHAETYVTLARSYLGRR